MDFDLKKTMILLAAQQLTELSEVNGTNEACLLGKGEHRSMAATLPARIRDRSAREIIKAMVRDFGQLKDETLLWR